MDAITLRMDVFAFQGALACLAASRLELCDEIGAVTFHRWHCGVDGTSAHRPGGEEPRGEARLTKLKWQESTHVDQREVGLQPGVQSASV